MITATAVDVEQSARIRCFASRLELRDDQLRSFFLTSESIGRDPLTRRSSPLVIQPSHGEVSTCRTGDDVSRAAGCVKLVGSKRRLVTTAARNDATGAFM